MTGPDRLLADLNTAQRDAVQATSGPLVILAGAGTGKTRAISRRAAYAIETGVVPADRILLVTFTEKAAGEMVERLAALGHPTVMARTFHAMALAQLMHFWPSRHGGAALPRILGSKMELLVPLTRRLPGGFKFTPAKDLADTIEWAKVRRIPPDRWVAEGADRAPLPADLFARLYRDFEAAKRRAGSIDFEDMLVMAIELLEGDADAAELVRRRKSWLSVDEYQDTNPLAERLLELWMGDRPDLAVVGDPNQTIYTFTGASPEYLLHFADRHPGARTVVLADNYRSTPQVLALANRLVGVRTDGGAGAGPAGGTSGDARASGGSGVALRATHPDGPVPTIQRFANATAELAALVSGVRRLIARDVAASEIAMLFRMNAQLPSVEDALVRAGIPFTVRGPRFYDRREVREARALIARARSTETGAALVVALRALFTERLGFAPDAGAGEGEEARERTSSLELLLAIAEDLVGHDAALDAAGLLAELDRRDAAEAGAIDAGVNLLTYHRAKGLEWDAVFLPGLEEGVLPIRYATTADEIAEELRLLYVGITRARVHLALSWAARRMGQRGSETARRPSPFLTVLEEPRPGPGGHAVSRAGRMAPAGAGSTTMETRDDLDADDRPLIEALQAWRRDRAKRDAVPAYVVAHDATLVAIAQARPGSSASLTGVKGMGPVKVERYGDEILEIVRRLRGG